MRSAGVGWAANGLCSRARGVSGEVVSSRRLEGLGLDHVLGGRVSL